MADSVIEVQYVLSGEIRKLFPTPSIISTTEIKFTMKGPLKGPLVYGVRVFNWKPGGGLSDAFQFEVKGPPATGGPTTPPE